MFVTFVSITIFNKVLKIKNLGEGKKMFQFTMISIAAAAITGSALAGPILSIKFDVDGNKSSILQEGTLTPFNDYSYAGSVGDGFPNATWVVGWDLVSKSSSTSFVTNGFTIGNLSPTTKRFNITLEIPNTLPSGGGGIPSWEFFGNLGGTLTSNTGAASILSSYGLNPLWQGLRGGTSPGVNSELLRGFIFSTPGATTAPIPMAQITKYTVVGGVGTSLGYQFQFELSGGSTASFAGNWSAALVPAPSALALVGLSGVNLLRRRRCM